MRKKPEISLDFNDAKVFGELIHLLNHKGTPIPIMGLLIGAIAYSKNLILISSDQNHFDVLKDVKENFKVEYW